MKAPLTPEDPTRPPGHTCPALDRVGAIVRRLGRQVGPSADGDVGEALALLEELRAAHVRLRGLAGR